MPSDWDADFRLLYVTDSGECLSITHVENGGPFDVRANVEIGGYLMENIDEFHLRVAVRNLMESNTVAIVQDRGTLVPQMGPFCDERRLTIPAGWTATAGDVLQAVASYEVFAGSNRTFSTAQSDTFVVS
jgi:hypothetical protein